MAIYVNNGPIVLPASGGTFGFSVEVDGGVFKDGKYVEEWDVTNTSSWLTCGYDEGQRDDNDYYYYFYGTADEITSTTVRMGYVDLSYTLEDGTTGSQRISIKQQGYCNISTDASNPIIFTAGRVSKKSGNGYQNVTVLYSGAETQTQIQDVYVNGYWDVLDVAGGKLNNGFGIDYEISALYDNVTDQPIDGNVNFRYNDSNGYLRTYFQYIRQEECKYPFGLQISRNGDYQDIPPVSSTNSLKMVTDIPFSGSIFYLHSYFPFGYQTNEVKFETWDEGSATHQVNGGDLIDYFGFEETYTIKFTENKTPNQRFANLTISYYSEDGILHTDTVRLRQNASDGSNLEYGITTPVSVARVESDGTPAMYDYYTVRYVGNVTPLTPVANSYSILGADANTALVDSEGSYIALSAEEVGWIHIGTPTIVEGAGTYNRVFEYPVTYDANDGAFVRKAMVVFGIEEDANLTATIEVIQARNKLDDYEPSPEIPVEGDEYIGPIWKDVEYDFGLAEKVDYTIYDDNSNLLFAGRTVKRPNANSNVILVNKICQNYMDIPELRKDIISVNGGYSVFHLKSVDGNMLYKTYKFVNDWSYSSDFKTGLLSHPILNDRIVYSKQMLPFSVFAAAARINITVGADYKEGATNGFDEPLNSLYYNEYAINEVRTFNFPYPNITDRDLIDTYYIDGEIWKVKTCGADYVLYYINPWGGYDWFPLDNKVIIQDDLTQHTYSQNYNNTTMQFGKRRYLSEINRKYNVITGWLKQDESDRMWYLLESNTVYLHNLNENKIIPVIIKDTSVEHKQKNRRQKIIQYTFTLEESQTRERI